MITQIYQMTSFNICEVTSALNCTFMVRRLSSWCLYNKVTKDYQLNLFMSTHIFLLKVDISKIRTWLCSPIVIEKWTESRKNRGRNSWRIANILSCMHGESDGISSFVTQDLQNYKKLSSSVLLFYFWVLYFCIETLTHKSMSTFYGQKILQT